MKFIFAFLLLFRASFAKTQIGHQIHQIQPGPSAITREEYDEIRLKIWEKMCESHGLKLQATFLRLSFHDCVGDACDGCVDLEDPDNKGLEPAVAALQEIFDSGVNLSLADLYVLAGQVAAEFGMEGNPGHKESPCNKGSIVKPKERYQCFITKKCCMKLFKVSTDSKVDKKFDFQFGRETCEDPSNEAWNLPASTLTHEEEFDYFEKEFADVSWTTDNTIAIMGAHTLGSMNKDNSEHDGPWISEPCGSTTFDNQFYKNLVNSQFSWSIENFAPSQDKPQFGCSSPFTLQGQSDCGNMLITDFNLRYNIPLGTNNQPQCIPHACPIVSSTDQMVQRYAANCPFWIEKYIEAWTKMVHHGYAGPGALSSIP